MKFNDFGFLAAREMQLKKNADLSNPDPLTRGKSLKRKKSPELTEDLKFYVARRGHDPLTSGL